MGEKETMSGADPGMAGIAEQKTAGSSSGTGMGRESGAPSVGELTQRDLAPGQASGRVAAPEVAEDGSGDGGPEPVDAAVVKSKSNITNN